MSSASIEAERRHLEDSRANLATMRERAVRLDRNTAGDWVSQQVLESALWRRMKQLEDDPEIPLFFGRLDYAQDDPQGRGERFYIGRRHVTDEQGDPMVVDWRADVSRAFYRASKAMPMGVHLRRRFGFQHGVLTAYEDEHLLAGEQEEYSAILENEIERPRQGPMRDIVATIQPEQDEIVRADLARSVCVQGAPGTGKSAVGLHRAAYLLYAHRRRLDRSGVLVIGPNDSFLRYIGDVLPALGEIDARQSTVEELVGGVPIRGTDSAYVATLKGDARWAAVIRRAVWDHVRTPTDGLVVPRGARRWRVASYEAAEIVDELRSRGVRYEAGRTMLPRRLAHQVLVRMELSGDSPDDRVHDAVARSRPTRAYADLVWPRLDPVRVVLRLLGDADHLAVCAHGLLSPDEQQAALWRRAPKGPGSAPWSLADAVLVDEATDVIERTASRGHVVLDEAQDLSPMMLRAVGRRCSTGSATVLGDLAQATTPWATRSWQEAMTHLGHPDAHVEELTAGFRVPGEVIELAARLLPQIAPRLRPPRSVRRARGDLRIGEVAEPDAAAVDLVRSALCGDGSIGVVAADARVGGVESRLRDAGVAFTRIGEVGDVDARVDVVPAPLAKGLEFDHVILLEPAEIVAAEPDEGTGLRRLYVCLTRAVSSLRIAHREPLPAALRAASHPAG